LFFASLLAHELGHAIVATHLDVQVEGITLWLFGGVSKLKSEATTPRDELAIAACGPMMSIGISLGFLLAAAGLSAAAAPELIVGLGLWLGTVNGILALFNLAPAAPLDGGRLLMAWLWHRRGNRLEAVVSAANAGRVFGYALIVVGLVEFAVGLGLSGLWLVFLGWFLLSAAQFEKSQAVQLNALAKHLVGELMTANPVVVPENLSVAALLDDFVLSHRFSSFPVQASDGKITGLVTLAKLRLVPASSRDMTCVKNIQTPISELVLTTPDERADQLATRLASSADGRALVMDHGTLLGIVSSTDVMRSIDRLMIRQEA
jgi:Zn-dependent protease/CBS domain-containing protein